jgi:hypothetical protein
MYLGADATGMDANVGDAVGVLLRSSFSCCRRHRHIPAECDENCREGNLSFRIIEKVVR